MSPHGRGGRTRPGAGECPLADQFREILEATDWISPELGAAVRAMETLTTVLAQGPSPYRQLLATLP